MRYTVKRENNRIAIKQSAVSRPGTHLAILGIIGWFIWLLMTGMVNSNPLILISGAFLLYSSLNFLNQKTTVFDFDNRGMITIERGITKRSHSIYRFEDLASRYLEIRTTSLFGIEFHSALVTLGSGEAHVLFSGIIGNSDREEALIAELNDSIARSLDPAPAQDELNP